MNYKEQLNPWVIHHLSADLTRSTVSRFRRRNEAESYLKVIQQLRPRAKFAIAFESELGMTDLSDFSKGSTPSAIS